jgi:hypothetical protein
MRFSPVSSSRRFPRLGNIAPWSWLFEEWSIVSPIEDHAEKTDRQIGKGYRAEPAGDRGDAFVAVTNVGEYAAVH